MRFLEGERPRLPLVSGGPHLIPQLSRSGGITRLAIANGSADPARPVIDVAFDDAPVAGQPRVTVLAPLSAPRAGSAVPDRNRLRSKTELTYRSWLILEWPTAD